MIHSTRTDSVHRADPWLEAIGLPNASEDRVGKVGQKLTDGPRFMKIHRIITAESPF